MTDLEEGFTLVTALPFLALLSRPVWKVGRRGGKTRGRKEGGAAYVRGASPARTHVKAQIEVTLALGPNCALSCLEPQTPQKESEAGTSSHWPGVTLGRAGTGLGSH